jgi:enterochelin esterase-like enzyme
MESSTIVSSLLNREVIVDVYLPSNFSKQSVSLLLINDGQDLRTMAFENIFQEFQERHPISMMCVAIHCSTDRKNEYGVIGIPDYKGRGARAGLYSRFVMEELIPFIRRFYGIDSFQEKAFAGFSLGALSALSIVWKYPEEFNLVGVFSGSLWWRSVSADLPYFDESKHLIMHKCVRNGKYYPWLRFFFEVGWKDETADRNNNGIIDAIDDTMSLIQTLRTVGYPNESIAYLELPDGKHDVATWARAFPTFLEWGWGKN